MLTSLALIFLVGLSMAEIVQKVKIPRIIGMLLTGIILGPFVLNRCVDLTYRDQTECQRKMVLRDFIYSQSYGAGGHRFCPAFHGTSLW